jgi:exopolysaccharide production protein ExoQ
MKAVSALAGRRGVLHPNAVVVALLLAAALLGLGLGTLSSHRAWRLLALLLAAPVAGGLAVHLGPAVIGRLRRLARGFRWWHWQWCAVFASALVFRVRDIDSVQAAPLDPWAVWRIGLMGLVALSLLGRLATRRTVWTETLLRGLPAGLFLCALVSLLSTVWSVYPLWTAYKSLEYLVDFALLAAILREVRHPDEVKSLFDLTWVFSGFFLLTVWLGVLLRPDLAVDRGIGVIDFQIHGILPLISSNGTGDEAGILLMVAGTRLLLRSRDRAVYWLVSAVALPTLILAQSRSPLVATLLALLTVLLLARRYRLLALVAMGGIALVSATAVESVVEQAFLRGQNTGLFLSLSGRTEWWAYGWEVLQQSPLLGFGGYAGARFSVLGPLGVTEASSIHNAWLEILLGVGLVGFLPFLVTFVGTWRTILRSPASWLPADFRALRLEAVGIFVILTFRSIFSVGFVWHPALLFFLVLIYAELFRRSAQAVPAKSGDPANARFRTEPLPARVGGG